MDRTWRICGSGNMKVSIRCTSNQFHLVPCRIIMMSSDTSLSQTPTPPPPPPMPLFFGSARSRSSLPVIQADLKEIGLYLGNGGSADEGESCRDLCLQCEHLAAKNQVSHQINVQLVRVHNILRYQFHNNLNLLSFFRACNY